MSKVVKLRRSRVCPWTLDVYLKASDKASKYYTNTCYDAFRYVTGLSFKEGEVKYLQITEVKRADSLCKRKGCHIIPRTHSHKGDV